MCCGIFKAVFRMGEITKEWNFDEIRQRAAVLVEQETEELIA